jgi:hypothetical protein
MKGAEVSEDYQFAGTSEEFQQLVDRAGRLHVRIDVIDRSAPRGPGQIIIDLVVAGGSEAVRTLVAEFVALLRRHRDGSGRRQPPSGSDGP